MTQEELARAMGFTRSYISQIEAGSKEPGERFMRDLGLIESGQFAHLKCSPRQLEQPSPATPMINLSAEGSTHGPLSEEQLVKGISQMMQWFVQTRGPELRLPLLRAALQYLEELSERERFKL